MAYKVISGYQDVEILMDSPEDLKDLSVNYAVGSIAYTADRSMHATLSPSKVWVEHKVGGGSGSGGTEMVEKVLYQTDNAVYEDFGGGEYGLYIENFPVITPGKTYKVELDGTTYECVGIATPIPHIGNLDVLDDGAVPIGEPFGIWDNDGEFIMMGTRTQFTRVKISVLEEKSSGSGGGMFVVNAIVNENEELAFDKTFDEVASAYESGMLPVLNTIQGFVRPLSVCSRNVGVVEFSGVCLNFDEPCYIEVYGITDRGMRYYRAGELTYEVIADEKFGKLPK